MPEPGPATSARRCGSSGPTPTWSSRPTTGRRGEPSGSPRYLTQQRDTYAYLHDQTLRRMNQGLDRHRDRRAVRAAAGLGVRVAHPRLLRLVQPQRQGDLPALPRLVRRQPGAPVALPAGGGGQPVRRVHGRRRGGARRRLARRSPRETCGGRPRSSATSSSPTPTTSKRASCLPRPWSSSGYGAENGLWRNIYLRGAEELRGPIAPPPPELASPAGARRADDRAALRLDRYPPRRAARRRSDAVHRLGVHRPRPHLPDRAVQRGAHPRRCRLRRAASPG